MKSSPIFTKTYDFLLWLTAHTEKYPKSERFRLAKRLEDTGFAFYELLVEAAYQDEAFHKLWEADIALTKLRFYVRMSHDRKLASLKQYEHASRLLAEIGKLLGGWMKKEQNEA